MECNRKLSDAKLEEKMRNKAFAKVPQDNLEAESEDQVVLPTLS